MRSYIFALMALGLGAGTASAKEQYTVPPADTFVKAPEHSNILQQISTGLNSVADNAQKALVFVKVSKTVDMRGLHPFDIFGFGFPGGRGQPMPPQVQKGAGSGFFVDLERGYVITNNHVIDDADEIELKLANGNTYLGKVIGRDANTDIAVVSVTDAKFDRNGLTALVLGDSDKLRVADFVVAVGAPLGLESSVSLGVVSAVGRGTLDITKFGDFIQTDAAINPGNSGGPLVGVDGKAYGMNTALLTRSGQYAGVSLAVPSNLVRKIASSLINDGSVSRGYLGVAYLPLTDEYAEALKLPRGTTGVLIESVDEKGAAARAGLRAQDVIIEVGGRKLAKRDDLQNVIGLMKPGTKARISVLRNGKTKHFTVEVGSYPGQSAKVAEKQQSEASGNPFGLVVRELTRDLKIQYGVQADSGLVIVSVKKKSPGEEAGLVPGDVILAVNGREFKSPAQLNKALKNVRKGQLALFFIEREGRNQFLPVRLMNSGS